MTPEKSAKKIQKKYFLVNTHPDVKSKLFGLTQKSLKIKRLADSTPHKSARTGVLREI